VIAGTPQLRSRVPKLFDIEARHIARSFARPGRCRGSCDCRLASSTSGSHEKVRRRVTTQGSLPSEDAAVVLLFSLVATGQIKLRRNDGWRKIAAVLSQQTEIAA
jgi:hypothetical protein